MGRLGRHSRPGPFGRKVNRHHRSAAAIQTTRNDPDERGLAWPITPRPFASRRCPVRPGRRHDGAGQLNAWHTSAGATYSWARRALNPHAGFLAGWPMLMYYTGGTTRGDWLKTFTSVTLGLARAVVAERWQAVGLSTMPPALVLTDGVGVAATPGGTDAPLEPVGPAITWEDGRAEAEGSAFREGFGGDALWGGWRGSVCKAPQPTAYPGRGSRPARLVGRVRGRAGAGVYGRMIRQELLSREPSFQLSVVMDESVLLRKIGDRGLMRAQLLRLAAAADLPNVELRVMPLSNRETSLVADSFQGTG
jgi:hypothetical protein